jgi:hypothetical protein
MGSVRWNLPEHRHYEAPLIEASRLTGQALVECGRADEAVHYLKDALRRSQTFVLVQEELPIRAALARAVLDDDPEYARSLIEKGFDGRAGPGYRWFTVDALTVLHDVHCRLGQTNRASERRRAALRLAEAPPGWSYIPGLRRLGALTRPGSYPDEQRTLPRFVLDLLSDLERGDRMDAF